MRRECEERFELTEALSQAREQLLELRKLRGGSPLSSCFPGPRSLPATAAASSRGARGAAGQSPAQGTGVPGRPGVPRPAPAPARPRSSGLPALQPPPRGRAASVGDSRQRLAALLRRRPDPR